MNSSRTFTALLVLGALLLTGCSQEEPEPKFADEPSASPTPEAKETAEEFIRRWAKAERDMQNSGESAEYRAMTGPCAPCQQLADDMAEVYKNGGWVKTDGMTIKSIESISKNTFRAVARIAPTEYVMAEGQPPGRFEGGERTYVVTLRKTAGDWILSTLLKEDAG